MSHPITMNWSNGSEDTLDYSNPFARDGTEPIPSPGVMSHGGTSSVSADQEHNLAAGPVGNYTWVNASDPTKVVACSYVHPSGKGQSSVTVSCAGYMVSSDHATWFTQHTFTDSSLQQHSAVIELYIVSN
ncbi:MAG: hypothetical protein AAGP08_05715 [Pseudomonadota bacterium]